MVGYFVKGQCNIILKPRTQARWNSKILQVKSSPFFWVTRPAPPTSEESEVMQTEFEKLEKIWWKGIGHFGVCVWFPVSPLYLLNFEDKSETVVPNVFLTRTSMSKCWIYTRNEIKGFLSFWSAWLKFFYLKWMFFKRSFQQKFKVTKEKNSIGKIFISEIFFSLGLYYLFLKISSPNEDCAKNLWKNGRSENSPQKYQVDISLRHIWTGLFVFIIR